jgi:hypothetical protein
VNFTATNGSSVEHVLPRRPTGQWLTDFPEAINIHAEQFGNLCLVPKSMNEGVGNSDYAAKLAEFGTLPETYKSALEVATFPNWTMAAVHQRTDRLCKLASQALGL